MDLVARHTQQIGHAISGIVGFLRRGIDRDTLGLHIGHSAARPHARMRMGRIFVFGADHTRGTGKTFLDLAILPLNGALDDWRMADVIMHFAMGRKIRLRLRPCDLQRLQRAHRIPFLRCDNGEQVLDMHDPRAGNFRNRGLIHPHRHRAGDGRAQHARMQHSGQAHVPWKIEFAEYLFWQVDAPDRLADDAVILVGLQGRIGRDIVRIAPLAVPFHIRIEGMSANEFGIGDRLRRIGLRTDRSLYDHQISHGNAKLFSRFRHKQATRLRCSLHQSRAAPGYALRTACTAHVECSRTVAENHAHVIEGDIEFLGNHLSYGGLEPLPAIDCAIEDIDNSVPVDGKVGVKPVGMQRGIVGRCG